MAEGTRVYTPEQATLNKRASGESDMYIVDGVYKFAQCSVLSINMSLGYNGTASSATLSMVQDIDNGDSFVPPTLPSIWSVSLPRGGVGAPIIYNVPLMTLNQSGFEGDNVPFYFAGICNDFRVGERNVGGNTISFSIVDPREVLRGVQCLLNGFALSQQIGAGSTGNDPRFENVNNVIDVFGYWNYGMESGRNEYGMPWSKIKEAIEAVRVTIKDMHFEFTFTGEPFLDAPTWYRIDDDIIDIVSLCQRVADDSGSDFIAVGRKTSSNTMLVEFRAIKRTKRNPLGQAELANFILARQDIVESVNMGREFRNEPDSSIIIGGMRNANYVAYPSEYLEEMHLKNGKEDYNAFPADIKVRLFGGAADATVDDGQTLTTEARPYPVRSGAIFPFWGFTPDDHAYPLIEPFLALDHLVIDRVTNATAHVTGRIPLCKISVKNFTVRNFPHTKVFLEGDQDPDDRPFAYLEEYIFAETNIEGYLRGLPLNTEVLRAALVGQEAFYSLYSLYYPDISDKIGLLSIDFASIAAYVNRAGRYADLANLNIDEYLYSYNKLYQNLYAVPKNPDGTFNANAGAWANIDQDTKEFGILTRFLEVLYEEVRQYALDCLGKRYIVCLPKSAIMQRIWQNLPVPTRPEKPEIEYTVDNVGYWQEVPTELDGIVNKQSTSTFDGSEEDQIRRKFMAEDGRFYAMAVMEFQPKGNVCFNSNGYNRAMFQDLPVSEFSPNKLAANDHNPKYVFISCQVHALVKRPDLAIVSMPAPITFDPTTANRLFREWDDGTADDEFIATKSGIVNYFWYFYKKNQTFRDALYNSATNNTISDLNPYLTSVFTAWANKLYSYKNEWYRFENSTEVIMDLNQVIIPLTSTWSSYGPYYYTYDDAQGMVNIQVDQSLVPWNFERPPAGQPWYKNLDAAGFERLGRTLSDLDYLDSASLVLLGFPEFGPASDFGYNSNVTGISVDFGAGGVRTTYSLATYAARPGTYRKGEYDNVSRARIDTREKLPDPNNSNIVHDVFAASTDRNRFPF
jgi:hypothetical protein